MFYTKNVGLKRLGLFTDENIAKNDVVYVLRGSITKNRSKHTIQVEKKLHLSVENVGKYINHSCDPNCKVRIITPFAILVSIKEIKKDEEVTFDYSTTESHLNMKCFCNSQNCRKTIKGYDDVTLWNKIKNILKYNKQSKMEGFDENM